MAVTETVIKTITIRGTVEGTAEVQKRLAGIAAEMGNVTVASEKQAKATLSVDNALKRLERTYDEQTRVQERLAGVQKTLLAAREQGRVTEERSAQIVELATERLNRNTAATRAATAAAQEQQARAREQATAIEDLRLRYDASFRAQKQLADVQKVLAQAVAAGTLSHQQAVVIQRQAIIDINRHANAQKSLADSSKVSRFELINLSRQLQDVGVSLASGQAFFTVLIQQGSQIADVFASSNATLKGFASTIGSIFARIFTLSRVAVGGVLALGIGAVTAGLQFASAQKDMERALLGIGRASGLSAANIREIAQATSSLSGLSLSEAAEAATTLARTGKIAGDQIKETVPLLKDFSLLIGENIPEAAKKMAAALADPAKGVEDLNQSLGSFDAATVELIRSLAASGDRLKAQQLIIQGVRSGLEGVSGTVSQSAQGWTAFGNVVSNVWTQIGEAVAKGLALTQGSAEQQLMDLEQQFKTLTEQSKSWVGIFAQATIQAELARITAEMEKLRKKTEDTAKQAEQVRINLRSTEVRGAIEAASPELKERKELEARLKLLQQQRRELEAADTTMVHIGHSAEQLTASIEDTERALRGVKSVSQTIKDDIDLAMKAAKARTVEDRAQLEIERARRQGRETEAEAQRRGQVVREQALTAEKEAADARRLSANQAVENARLEASLVGQTAGRQQELRANLQAKHQLEQESLKTKGDAAQLDKEELERLMKINAGLRVGVDTATQRNLARDLNRERQFLTMTEEEIQIAERLKDVYPDITTAINSNEAAMIRFNNRVKEARDLTGDFLNTFIQGMLQGESATKSLSNALKSLGQSITSSAVKNIGAQIAGTVGTAGAGVLGLGGAAAGGAGGLGGIATGGLGSAIGGAALAGGLAAGVATAGIGLAVGVGISLLADALDDSEEKAEEAAHAQALLAQQQQRQAETARLAAEAQQRLAAAQERSRGLETRMLEATTDAETLAGQLALFDRKAYLERFEEQRQGGENMVQLEEVQQVERANIIKKFNDEAAAEAARAADELARIAREAAEEQQRIAEQAAERRQRLEDRLFATQTDTSTLAGALAAFDRDAQRQILEEHKAGGENIVLLEQVLMAERLQVIKRFEDERTRLIKDANENIQEYLKSLLFGPQSVASPQNQLIAAQQEFNKQLALAQAGDITALQNITRIAESYRSIARSFYGSTQGYQTIEGSIVNALRNLPASPVAGPGVVSGQAGGLVVGGVAGKDSVPALLEPGEMIIRRSVAAANPWLMGLNRGERGANDNVEIAGMRRDIVFMLAQIARLIDRSDKSNVEAISAQQRSANAETRQQEAAAQARQRRRVAS